jgi:light-regulated signal transduction histidine kinase (bacteriophytochrome)
MSHAQRSQDILNAIADPVLLFDQSHHHVFSNDAARRLFFKTNDSTVGMTLFEFTQQFENAEHLFHELQKVEKKKIHIVAETITCRSGESFLLEAQRIPLTYTTSDTVVKLSNIDPLVEAMAKLRHSNTELRQFAYVASHDLQEPLRKIASFLQILEEDHAPLLNEEARKCIDFAVDGAKRLQGLIDDLLVYSGLVASNRIPFEEVNLAEIVNRVLENLSMAIEDTGATVNVTEPLPTVSGVPSQLEQLLQNLIGNALKYRKQGTPSVVKISATQKGRNFEMCVSDNGIGIDPQFHDRVFTIFQRLHTREQYSGTGIGLAICKKIVQNHGGRIWLESELGSGVTVYFTLKNTSP